MFDALVIDKQEDKFSVELRQLEQSALPDADVLVRVEWSTINYKDALALTNRGPIVRRFPMVPGIDFSGEVVETRSVDIKIGDKVVLNGWGVGEQHWGGLSQFARVKSEWLIPLPQSFSTKQAMEIGTAGYTAMLCVMALEKAGVMPESGPVLVTGASGGVGSIALILLSRLGYEPTAVTGRMQEQAYLRKLGAKDVIDRATLSKPGRPLEKALWAGAIDVAGGQILASICAAIQPRGAVAACGLAAGMEFPSTVAPFILRGVSLIGIDSVYCPRAERIEAWRRLSELIASSQLDETVSEVSLACAPAAAHDLLDGRSKGRVLVDVG